MTVRKKAVIAKNIRRMNFIVFYYCPDGEKKNNFHVIKLLGTYALRRIKVDLNLK